MNDLTRNAHSDVDVLVVGAGPTGLTLACDLARRGVRVRIVEKNREPFAGSRGKGLQPRTLEVFDDLGVIDAAIAAGGEYPRLRVHLGWLSFSWSMHARVSPTSDVPYPNIWMLPQARTEAILRARLEELGGSVELGTPVTAVEQDDDGVSATLARDGTDERVRARYLVGADGGHSFVRKALGVPFSGNHGPLPPAIVGDVRVSGLDPRSWHAWPRAKWGPVALCPLPNEELFQLFMQVDPTFEPDLTASSVGSLAAQAIPRCPFVLRDATWLSRYRPNVRLADRYRIGRVFLAGDAAHVHPPTGGQGLNAGVQDAYNLGWKLGAVLAGAPDDLLDTYEEERRPVAAGILGLSSALYRNKQGRRGDATKQLRTSYRESSIARDLRTPTRGPVAGDRAPDARGVDPSGRERRVFDLLRGPHATLLAFGEGAARAARDATAVRNVKVAYVASSSRGAGAPDLIDVSGEIRRTYGVDDDAFVLVRPDGYVGFAAGASAASELGGYLDRIDPPRSA